MDNRCPRCGDLIVFPDDDDPFCEDCGWPDDDLDIEKIQKYADKKLPTKGDRKDYVPDLRFYCNKTAKQQILFFGWVLYYIGAVKFYLDYQVWKVKFRIWHPLVWVYLVLMSPFILWYGLKDTGPEISSYFKMDRKYKPWTYGRIRKYERNKKDRKTS